jgi:AraC-like DNA-binding protein
MVEKEPLHLILLNAGRAVHEGDWNWKNIKSPFFRLYLVEEGRAGMIIEGREQLLTPGHLCLIPPFTLHSDRCDAHFALFYLHICEDHIRNISLFEQFQLPFEIEATPLDYQLMRRLLEINPGKGLAVYDPESYDNNASFFKSLIETAQTSFPVQTETNGILQQLLAHFLAVSERNIVSQDTRIMKVLHYIRENMDKKIFIRELSALCYLSDDHLTRLFKQEMNDTPIDYINRKKIEKAQQMMVLDNLPIKDIACSLAFENISYFNRLFKQIVGKTPTQYRDSLGRAKNC